MELGSVLEFLENKSILVTGSTGFLAKIFVEKVLRVQPCVKKLYLLIRASDTKSATERLHNEVIGKEIFRTLREKYGTGFDSFISNKVTAVPGDTTLENLGIRNLDLGESMLREVNVIINSAATTKFDQRYDVALSSNTLSAKHVLDFAKKCLQLEVLLQVSTAYVCGEKSGIIQEEPLRMGEALNGQPGLDIQRELELIKSNLEKLKEENSSKEMERLAMKQYGIKRARFFGWPNTYVFTKALGEMLIGHTRDNLPVIIVRPTIITSTYKEPFPGWVEGVRTIDSVAVSYGKGKLNCFLGDNESILDMIPGDMVVNAMIIAMVAHANQPAQYIYHVGSSIANPISPTVLGDYGYCYFSENPWMDKDGKPIIVQKPYILTKVENFHRYVAIRYILPLKGLKLLNAVCCQRFSPLYGDLSRKISSVRYLVELYGPYVFFKGIFDDLNTEKLRKAIKANEVEVDMFYFDPKILDWDDYFLNVHVPGFVRYVMQGRPIDKKLKI